MSKIAVCGVSGRMGQRLAHLTLEAEDLKLVGGTEHAGHASIGADIGQVVGAPQLGFEVVDSLRSPAADADVVIAFTTPEATLKDAAICAEMGVPMVVGTTGFTEEQLRDFKQSVSALPCVFASNFSTAMNVLFKLVQDAASILGDDYDVEILEMHHHFKVDAPSGSAITLGEKAAAGLGRDLKDVVKNGREGLVGQREKMEIGMHALRAGDIAGVHKVFYGAPGEYIELGHTATSRDAFALGALRAARFVAGAEARLYSMGDVLGIE
ncbi:MAG: 4-hydroxy-tetrahydrodipicolinate reductase [Candidatus Latescibacterota bacterium]|nr:4-hydroxy-tetrahydrodipicolinate reductase [Candidatus Latescibacterota bacterium]MEE2728609.1 4-hydroxy-tetrahydrodipicolinate reductase [Candidatus Latescibacterota bacterium]